MAAGLCLQDNIQLVDICHKRCTDVDGGIADFKYSNNKIGRCQPGQEPSD